jgi:hypothetical protein
LDLFALLDSPTTLFVAGKFIAKPPLLLKNVVKKYEGGRSGVPELFGSEFSLLVSTG